MVYLDVQNKAVSQRLPPVFKHTCRPNVYFLGRVNTSKIAKTRRRSIIARPIICSYVNGEEIDVSGENEAETMTARAWRAYAEGRDGDYPTLEDAVVLKQQVEAIRKAVKSGEKVLVADVF